MIEQFFASLSDGLLLGFVYGLAAMGLTLIFGVMRVINLAHGPIIALGMFGVLIFSHPESVFSSEASQATTTYAVLNTMRMHPYLALILVAVLGLLFGIVMYSVSVHRVLNASQLSSLLGTFSVNMIIIGVGTALLTTNTFAVDFRWAAWNWARSPCRGRAWWQRGALCSSPGDCTCFCIAPRRAKLSALWPIIARRRS
ncbi:MAG: hypothetical protein HC875_27410 [Anaerolineales bacterium]|nr:hypothetical protein [Anaerolineales bacterium]